MRNRLCHLLRLDYPPRATDPFHRSSPLALPFFPPRLPMKCTSRVQGGGGGRNAASGKQRDARSVSALNDDDANICRSRAREGKIGKVGGVDGGRVEEEGEAEGRGIPRCGSQRENIVSKSILVASRRDTADCFVAYVGNLNRMKGREGRGGRTGGKYNGGGSTGVVDPRGG